MGNNSFFGSITLDVIYMYTNSFGPYSSFIASCVLKVNSKCSLTYILPYYSPGNKTE